MDTMEWIRMDFKEWLYNDVDGLLDHDMVIILTSGNVIVCRSTDDYRTEIVVHEDFLIVEHMKMDEDNVLNPVMTDYIPIGMIVKISTTWEDEYEN